MLSITIGPIMLSILMLSVALNPIVLRVIKPSVVMLRVIMQTVTILPVIYAEFCYPECLSY
jgi:hypothetical protein